MYSNSALENFSHDYVVERKNHHDEGVADSNDGDMDGVEDSPVEVESKAAPGSADAECDQIKSYFLGGFGTCEKKLFA